MERSCHCLSEWLLFCFFLWHLGFIDGFSFLSASECLGNLLEEPKGTIVIQPGLSARFGQSPYPTTRRVDQTSLCKIELRPSERIIKARKTIFVYAIKLSIGNMKPLGNLRVYLFRTGAVAQVA